MGVNDLETEWLALALFDDVQRVTASDSLTFGRRADLVVDANPFMHRVVGRIVHRQGAWWLQNHGSSTRIELCSPHRGSSLIAGPGEQLPVVSTEFLVRFTAGPTAYELSGQRSGVELTIDESGSIIGTSTLDFGSVPLSPEQHLLLVALYESASRNHGSIEGSSTIARRLGWTPKKFHRKLDAVCLKLSRQGVRGLKGDTADQADCRRAALLEHALNAGLVGSGDLGLLRPEPQSA